MAGKLQCEVIDADVIAKKLWHREDVKAVAMLRWGNKILDSCGEIINAEISRIIFTEEAEHEFCNKLIHPLVMSELKERAANCERAVIEIPLLFEAGRPDWVDFVVYVAAGFDVRAKRCRKSRGWSEEELIRREKYLLPASEKIKLSDNVIHNDGSIIELEEQLSQEREN